MASTATHAVLTSKELFAVVTCYQDGPPLDVGKLYARYRSDPSRNAEHFTYEQASLALESFPDLMVQRYDKRFWRGRLVLMAIEYGDIELLRHLWRMAHAEPWSSRVEYAFDADMVMRAAVESDNATVLAWIHLTTGFAFSVELMASALHNGKLVAAQWLEDTVGGAEMLQVAQEFDMDIALESDKAHLLRYLVDRRGHGVLTPHSVFTASKAKSLAPLHFLYDRHHPLFTPKIVSSSVKGARTAERVQWFVDRFEMEWDSDTFNSFANHDQADLLQYVNDHQPQAWEIIITSYRSQLPASVRTYSYKVNAFLLSIGEYRPSKTQLAHVMSSMDDQDKMTALQLLLPSSLIHDLHKTILQYSISTDPSYFRPYIHCMLHHESSTCRIHAAVRTLVTQLVFTGDAGPMTRALNDVKSRAILNSTKQAQVELAATAGAITTDRGDDVRGAMLLASHRGFRCDELVHVLLELDCARQPAVLCDLEFLSLCMEFAHATTTGQLILAHMDTLRV